MAKVERPGMKPAHRLFCALFLCTGLSWAEPQPALNPVDSNQLQALVVGAAADMKLPGALVLLRTPQGEFLFSAGTTELGRQNAPTKDTHYRIASNTKTFTAATTLLLAQEGKLRLEDPISKYVAGVPNGDQITLKLLLSMRSGLYNYTNAPELAKKLDEQPAHEWKPDEYLPMAFSRPVNFAPGTAYEYCNTNYALLGLVAEKLEGKPLDQIFQERLFGPFGLKQTQLRADTALPEPYSHGYMYGGSAYALIDIDYSPEMQAEGRAGKLLPRDYTASSSSYATAAGGALATAADQADWIQALVDGRVFQADTQQRWFRDLWPQDANRPDGQLYGYGITRMHWAENTIYFHGGEMPGFNSFIGRDPEHKVTLVVWTNLTLSLQGETTANALMLKILDKLYRVSPLPGK